MVHALPQTLELVSPALAILSFSTLKAIRAIPLFGPTPLPGFLRKPGFKIGQRLFLLKTSRFAAYPRSVSGTALAAGA